ncbi:hypothetical protein HPB47_021644 [Ixodes persulcatus]|uniref:Uncharacterized protein n=1 Tax=Ixodes persulcatus TaxID=34615 RepID=A0AC60QE75_IXOPE|nr:hypothetical protein HPB47_021644 [Ixodes persulcatus]
MSGGTAVFPFGPTTDETRNVYYGRQVENMAKARVASYEAKNGGTRSFLEDIPSFHYAGEEQVPGRRKSKPDENRSYHRGSDHDTGYTSGRVAVVSLRSVARRYHYQEYHQKHPKHGTSTHKKAHLDLAHIPSHTG